MWEEETLYVNILFLLVKDSRCWLLPETSHYCQHQRETTHLCKTGSRRRVSIAPGKGVETKKFVHFDFNYIINVISVYVYRNKKVCLLFNNEQHFKCNRRYTAKSTSHDQDCRWSTWDTQAQWGGLQHVSVVICKAQTSSWEELFKSKHYTRKCYILHRQLLTAMDCNWRWTINYHHNTGEITVGCL